MTTLAMDKGTAHLNEVAAGVPMTAGPTLGDRIAALFSTIIASTERRAKVRVDGYLASLNDETLIDLGLDPLEVRQRGADPLTRFHL